MQCKKCEGHLQDLGPHYKSFSFTFATFMAIFGCNYGRDGWDLRRKSVKRPSTLLRGRKLS